MLCVHQFEASPWESCYAWVTTYMQLYYFICTLNTETVRAGVDPADAYLSGVASTTPSRDY